MSKRYYEIALSYDLTHKYHTAAVENRGRP